MDSWELKKHIESLCSHVTFEWNGKECGVDPFSSTEFEMWCGENCMTATSVMEVMTVHFFDGFSLEQIVDKIKNIEM